MIRGNSMLLPLLTQSVLIDFICHMFMRTEGLSAFDNRNHATTQKMPASASGPTLPR